MSNLEKPKDSSFKTALSEYQLGGGGPLSKQIITLIFLSLLVYFVVGTIGVSNFVSVSLFHFFVALQIFYVLHLIFNTKQPSEPED